MKNNIRAMYPLTPIQQGMLLHSQTSEANDQYTVQLYLPVVGKMTEEQLQKAFQQLVERHDIFRTVFMHQKTKSPVQVVLAKRMAQIMTVDYSDRQHNQDDMKAFWQKAKKFDLEKDLLLELVWFQFEDQQVLSFRFHHILLDGWSMGIVLNDFQNLLNQKACIIQEEELFSFGDYVQTIQRADKATALTYWQHYLADYEADFQLIGNDTYETNNYEKQSFTLDEKTFKKMNQTLKAQGISVNTALQTAWGIVLQKYTYSDDVVFGSVVSGRNLPLDNIETGVGLYINTLPTRITSTPEETVGEVLQKVQKHGEASCEYEFCNLSDIQQVSEIKGEFFDHILAFENYPFNLEEEESDSLITFQNVRGDEQNNYKLNIKAMLQGEIFSVEFTYCSEIFTEKEIQQMMNHLITVFNIMANGIETKMSQLTIVSKEEEEELLHRNSGLDVAFDEECLTEFLSGRLSLSPKQVFLSDATVSYTYEQVERLTNQIARMILDKGLKKEDVVGLYMDRTASTVLAMLGLLKAGVAFLPLDLTVPKDRVEFMLKDSGAKLLVSDTGAADLSVEMDLITDLLATIKKYDDNKLTDRTANSDLAYIIYTSGTTGNPKGTMMERCGLINLILDMEKRYERDHIAMVSLSSISFDMFLYELTYCLGRQGEFVIASEEERKDMELLLCLLEERNIQSMITTPSRIGLMIDHPKALTVFKQFKTLIIGGESLKPEVFEKVRKVVGGEIQNAYGPTETTVICLVKEQMQVGEKITIGRPLLNTKLLVLDKNLTLVPCGGIGELYVVTPGIMRGYLHNSDLTDAVKVTCKEIAGQKMYKTGDFAKWTDDGEIEFIGRIDGQHKIRGQRIEVGEIENKLLTLTGITDSVVSIMENAQKNLKLVAFYTGCEQSKEVLREKLKKQLPIYMIPDRFIFMDELPTTVNGKVNKGKLRTIFEREEAAQSEDSKLAVTEVQKKIAAIWTEILGADQYSVDADFYESGGNSLLAMSLASNLSRAFNKTIKVSDILKNLSIMEQEKLVIDSSEKIVIPRRKQTKQMLLSRAEKRMYVVEQQSKGSSVYNTFLVLSVKGDLVIKKLQAVLNKLAEYHESLNVQFIENAQGIVKQKINKKNIPIYSHQMKEKEFLKNGSKLVNEFDLQNGPLWEAHVIELTDCSQEQRLLLSFSHIIMDGFSMDVFVEDFKTLMNDEQLSDEGRNYSDYACYEAELTYEKERAFFVEEMTEFPDTALTTDYPRPKEPRFNGKNSMKVLDASLVDQLIEWCRREKITVNTCLMGLYQLILMKYADKTDFVIGTVTGNRDILDTKRMIGMFANTIPVRTKIQATDDIVNYLKAFQNKYEEILKHQHYPFDLLVNELGQIGTEKKELFHHAFIFQNVSAASCTFEADNVLFEPCIDFKTPEAAKYDLSFEVLDYGKHIEIVANYDSDLYSEKTISNLLSSYQQLIEETITASEKKLVDLTILSADQQRELITLGAGAEGEYSEGNLLVKRLKQLAITQPNSEAVRFKDRIVTFEELEEKSENLARSLLSEGVEENSVVGIYLERTEMFIISMLAVLKVRAAYLPIDKGLPNERVTYMLEDSDCALVITDQEIEWSSLDISTGIPEIVGRLPIQHYSLNDRAYMTYTSGTTGKPKGVILTHNSLTSLLANIHTYLHLGVGDRLLALASVSFDMFSSEIWMALYNGAGVVLLEDEKRYSTEKTVQTIAEEEITMIITTPSRIENCFDTMVDMNAFDSLTDIVFGGEALGKELVNKIKNLDETIRLYNGYGPTEATMYCSIAKVHKAQEITIGHAIPNTGIYMLDSNLKLTPRGFSGELCVGGQALAEGYMNLAEETAEKFVTLPEIGRVYRTGDFARWDIAGNIQFLGRMDNQVKINGYRVEAAEIEKELIRFSRQQSCKVIAHKVEEQWEIVAFTTSKDDLDGVRQKLSSVLPYYMVPKHILSVPELPTTINGKVDERKLLGMLDKQKQETQVRFAESTLEKVVESVILAKLPQLEQVDLHKHFMDIGGDSFKALEVISAFREKGYTISINEFMNQGNLYSIAANLKKVIEEKKQDISEEKVLSPMHQKVLEYNSLSAINGFTQTVLLEDVTPIDKHKMEELLKKILEEHAMLRSYYPLKAGKRVHAYGTVEDRLIINEMVYEKPTAEEVRSIAGKQEQLIDIEDSLFRVTLVNSSGNETSYCILTLHHFLLDTISWMILLEELTGLYNGQKQQLQQSSSTFHEWLEKSITYAEGNEFDEEVAYWDALQQLPNTGFTPNYVGDMALCEFTLSSKETMELKEIVKQSHINMDAFLITGFGNSLFNLNKEDELLIELESHGRTFDYGSLDLSQTIGWFTSPYPVKLKRADIYCQGAVTIDRVLNEVPSKGRGYSIKKYLNNDRHYTMEPRYVFNNLGEVRSSVEKAEGLSLSTVEFGNVPPQDFCVNYEIYCYSRITKGKINVGVQYNQQKYSEEEISRFLTDFKQQLVSNSVKKEPKITINAQFLKRVSV